MVFCRSESPSQVFLIVITWLYNVLKEIPVDLWGNVVLVYDNMCHLDGMRAARCALPFPKPWDNMWQAIGKVLDRFHFSNHVDESCKVKYNPENFLLNDDNSEVAEQTFVWVRRFKKIVCAMPKVHHLFFYIAWLSGETSTPHCVISVVRNRYCQRRRRGKKITKIL
jgi:hypothetical protein